jgi:hypothetical protein
MDDLATEYVGRARVARFMIMTGYWTLPSAAIRDKYNVNAVPIVVLFDKGVEVKRWVLNFSHDDYRNELNKVLKRHGPENGLAAGEAVRGEGSLTPPSLAPPDGTSVRPKVVSLGAASPDTAAFGL